MNRTIKIVFIVFFHSLAAQTDHLSISHDSFLFTFRDHSYIISGDSLYEQNNDFKWNSSKHNFVIDDFVFFHNESKGYLMHNSGGITYEFDGSTFRRIDDSFNFQSQYESYSFLYDDNVYTFGGYGLFTFKNIITYFNNSKKETELLTVKTPLSLLPEGRKKMLAQFNNGQLFIGPGLGYNTKIVYGNQDSGVINDYWAFDFRTKEWQKLGEGNSLFTNEEYQPIYDFDNKTLVISQSKVYLVDIENNLLHHYDEANFDIIKSTKTYKKRYLITHNRALDGFFLALDKGGVESKVIFTSALELLGPITKTEQLYSNSNYRIVFIMIVGLALILFLLIFFRKQNKIQLLEAKRKEIQAVLSKEEAHLYQSILENYPDYISFPDLMSAFEDHLSYENKKKKLRAALNQIELKIQRVIKRKSNIFLERKSKEDMRIKEIRIK